jgi:hypothetical protein
MAYFVRPMFPVAAAAWRCNSGRVIDGLPVITTRPSDSINDNAKRTTSRTSRRRRFGNTSTQKIQVASFIVVLVPNVFGDRAASAREWANRTSPLLNPFSGSTRRGIDLGRYMQVAKLAGVVPLLLRAPAVQRTPGIVALFGKVEHRLFEKVGVLAVIYIGGDTWKGKIECAAIEWRQLFSGRRALEQRCLTRVCWNWRVWAWLTTMEQEGVICR